MPTVLDAAEYILQQKGEMTAMKLQKLVYYAQAWALVWDEEPLFPDRIEAWANGPVSPALYYAHKGMFTVSTVGGNPKKLSETQTETLDAILQTYGDRPAAVLSDLTHAESPWKDARGTTPPWERSDKVITHAALAEYYGSL